MRHYFFLLTLLATLTLDANELIPAGSLNVKLVPATKVEKVPLGNYLGNYSYPSAHRFILSANVAGFVSKIFVKPYRKVKKGEKLFVLTSPKLLDLQSDYISTLLEFEFYEKEVKRLDPLAKKGVVASKRYIEAKNQFEKLRTSKEFKRSLLKAYGLSQSQINKITKEYKPYPILTIRAPANATVSDIEVQMGSYVHQGDTLAKLVNTTECHFEVAMPWQLTSPLKVGDKLFTQKNTFTIIAISPEINPLSQTRSIDLHDNKGCNKRGGASMNVTLYKNESAWSVPSSAIVHMNGSYVIFIAEKNAFRPLPVKLLAQVEGKNFISADLHLNDRIAVTSVLALKSAAEGAEE
ncbi:efflux RND transporter periplasmic adaptor subunit [Sulfurimonas sp.]